MSHIFLMAEHPQESGDEKFREFIRTRPYINPPKTNIQLREIRFYDVAVPHKLEEKFLNDMARQHNPEKDANGFRAETIKKARKLITRFIPGLEDVDLDDYNRDEGEKLPTSSKFIVLGRMKDRWKETGKGSKKEMY